MKTIEMQKIGELISELIRHGFDLKIGFDAGGGGWYSVSGNDSNGRYFESIHPTLLECLREITSDARQDLGERWQPVENREDETSLQAAIEAFELPWTFSEIRTHYTNDPTGRWHLCIMEDWKSPDPLFMIQGPKLETLKSGLAFLQDWVDTSNP